MNRNYQKEMEKVIGCLEEEEKVPKLLLHLRRIDAQTVVNRYLAPFVFCESVCNFRQQEQQTRTPAQIKQKQVEATLSVVNRVVKIINIHFHTSKNIGSITGLLSVLR